MGLGGEGPDIDGVWQGEGVDRGLRCHHAAGFEEAGQDDAVRGGEQTGVVQGRPRLGPGGFGGGQAGLGGADVLPARPFTEQVMTLLGHDQARSRLIMVR